MTSIRKVAVASAFVAAVVVSLGAQGAGPLPVPETLYKAVRDNLVRAENVAHLYAFKERRTDVHTNPFGRIGTGGTRVFEVYPSATRQLTYRRLIERNGAPLTAAEIAEQDRAYRARVADVQRRLAERTADELQRAEADSSRARERRRLRIEDIVTVLQFSLDGRTVHGGVPALLISFAPKPGAKPATREGRVAVNFHGKVWIDEAASEVMRVEATSIDDITFGFGLVARVGKGAEASVTRRRVDDDLWMPTRITLNGRGRAALFRTLVLDFAVDWFDYRRIDAASAAPFLESRE